MLRVSLVTERPGETRLLLEGEISAEWVLALEQQCIGLLEQRNRVVLDFKNVTSVDRRGIWMLRRLSALRCEFMECPPVIADLLKVE